MKKQRWNLVAGLAFLAPNIAGFLAFTLIPLVLSLVLAFSNWDLKRHNMFHPEKHIQMNGGYNFHELFASPDFWKFLGNTLFFMMAMPFGIAASLIAAILLSKDLRGGSRRVYVAMIAGAILLTSTVLLVVAGAGGSGMVILLTGMAGFILILGAVGGNATYRTLFYVPNFTSGVATLLLWKKMYNSQTGPINTVLYSPIHNLSVAINRAPPWTINHLAAGACAGLAILVAGLGLMRLRRMLADSDLGKPAAIAPIYFLLLPLAVAAAWSSGSAAITGLSLVSGIGAWAILAGIIRRDAQLPIKRWDGLGETLMLSLGLMSAEFVLIGLAAVCRHLPQWASVAPGLQPPLWLTDLNWAKPAMMIMGFWGAVGSNTMLLYLAALTTVPLDLYEAADIDGARRFTKFWNVTWPQLAPTTFFVVVMGVIGGLQGGFESAKVMTGGGPAGSTTTLAYFIYNEGFTTGRLGYSSAVAWTMFLLVLVLTLVNFTFGNKYVND